MTEWLPINMQPIASEFKHSTYRFSCAVKKGWKYRYWFVCNGIKTLDKTKEVSKRGDNELSHVIWVTDLSIDETAIE